MRILILGGTSGIGLALARHYLARGDEVTVCGRDLSRLPADLAHPADGADRPPRLRAIQLDITDRPALAAVLDGCAATGLDLLVVAAGFYFNHRRQVIDAVSALRMLQTHLGALTLAFEVAGEGMLRRRAGHLVAISSVAGLLQDHPGASLYSATKRSVLSLCDSYRAALKPFGIAVTAIVPGYVDTAQLRTLNGGDASRKPFIVSEAEAVARIVQAIAERRSVCVFPWQMRWLIAVANRLPKALLQLRR